MIFPLTGLLAETEAYVCFSSTEPRFPVSIACAALSVLSVPTDWGT
jgi:hypothetical protein